MIVKRLRNGTQIGMMDQSKKLRSNLSSSLECASVLNTNSDYSSAAFLLGTCVRDSALALCPRTRVCANERVSVQQKKSSARAFVRACVFACVRVANHHLSGRRLIANHHLSAISPLSWRRLKSPEVTCACDHTLIYRHTRYTPSVIGTTI